MNKEGRYSRRGVSADKAEVHKAIRNLDKGLYSNSFCKILPDLVAGDKDYCNIMHADTSGTKTSLAYIYWRETDDISVWGGVAQDALVMNLDDMACVGCVDNMVVSSTIGRNKGLIPAEVLEAIIGGTQSFLEKMEHYGVRIRLAGGETADVGDIVRTVDVGITAFGRMRRQELVLCNIEPGDCIVGLASFGQAIYEEEYNAGMGSNGLTSGRHDVLHHRYASNYPESFDPAVPQDLVYSGSRALDEKINISQQGSISVGKLLLSPTRTYMPILARILGFCRDEISSLIHCTGGGQTKVLKFLTKGRIVKDNLFSLPPLFRLIEAESGTPRKEMYEVFNMGHRMEVYCKPSVAQEIISISNSFGVEAKIIGRVEESPMSELLIEDEKGQYHYSA